MSDDDGRRLLGSFGAFSVAVLLLIAAALYMLVAVVWPFLL